MKTKTKRMLGIGATVLSLLAGSAYGQWIGPTWSPPGGVTWSNLSPGNAAGHVGGATWQVSDLDLGASDDLYFGVHSDYYPTIGIVNSYTNALTYNSSSIDLLNGQAVWTGSVTIPLGSGGSTVRDARYVLTLTDLNNNPLSLIDSTTVSTFPTIQQGILDVSTTEFNLNHQFEIYDGSGFDAALKVYNELGTVGGTQLLTSTSGGFYAIPEPGVVSMVAVCAGGLWFIRRRFV